MSQSSQAVQFAAQERALYDEIVRRIVALADPDKIIVFGSRARGDHRADSDIDILVIKESTEPRYKRSRVLYGALANLPAQSTSTSRSTRLRRSPTGVRFVRHL